MHYHQVTLILSLIGFAIAFHIWYTKTRNEKLVCYIGKDCNAVIESEHSEHFGVENATWGMIYFIGIFIISVISLLWPETMMLSFFLTSHLIITGAAALVSLYLLVLQAFVVKHFCEYCLASTAIIIAIFLFMAI